MYYNVRVSTIPVAEKPFLTTNGLHYVTDSSVGMGTRISRSDVARFLLKECVEGKHRKDVVAVCV